MAVVCLYLMFGVLTITLHDRHQRVKRKQSLCVRYKVVSVVNIKIMFSWLVMLCDLLGRYQCSGGIYVKECCEDGSSRIL
jgi:hypothetical protein